MREIRARVRHPNKLLLRDVHSLTDVLVTLVTAPGEDSHLTKVMKSYYLEKAKSHNDLPTWLFTAQELRAAGARTAPVSRRSTDDRYDRDYNAAPAPAPSRGLRDVYDAAAASSRRDDYDRVQRTPTASKANDRLRAMREAKRNVSRRPDAIEIPPQNDWDGRMDTRRVMGSRNNWEEDRGSARPAPVATTPRAPPPRVGLPSRPGARRV